MKKIKFGIIGCGRIGQRHAGHIAQRGELVAVCDIEPKAVESLAEKFNAEAYVEFEKMFSSHPDLDVVAICTPNGLHAEHSIAASEAGFHVLCEKPLATNVYDCGRMIQAAEHANRRLFVVKQNRYNPPVAAVKKIIEEKRLGKLLSVHLGCYWNRNEDYYRDSWKGTQLLDGGTLFTQFSHFVDLLYWLFGDVKDVQARFKNFIHEGMIEFEDTGIVLLEFYNGMLGTIHYTVNSYQKNMEGSLTIFGEKGTVKIGGQYLNVLEYQNIEGYEIKNLPQGNQSNDYGKYQGSMSNHGEVYDNLISVLTEGKAITTSAFEGLKTVEIIERIYQTAKK